ncbi:LLM class flavin-dependent oxidoreductase [Nocardioides campestrisoli]|uniref:LLM class flavin-dependent oxidoreductase n=1 Tax=Nocardioides campestrisoli TaxID=2736757 RepID=UPI00163D4197|nr:LLM class flavin-dependent oxidoreductase [Nocardioides campestrisoli]
MEIGLVDLFDGSAERDLAFMRDFSQTAEELGFTGIWLPEHLVFFEQYDSVYPYPAAPSASDPERTEVHNKVEDGKARVEAAQDQGLLDVAMAAATVLGFTERLRIGSSVLLLPTRNVRLFARELMTLSALTGDRFDLGVGVGWAAEEFQAAGSPFRIRGMRSEQNLGELDRLWAADDEGLVLPDPRPARPRILVGGHSPAAIRRAATVAGGWYPWNLTPSQFGEHHASFRDQAAEAGKDVDALHAVAGFRFLGAWDQLPDLVDRYAAHGADGVNLSLRMTTENYVETMQSISDALGLVA